MGMRVAVEAEYVLCKVNGTCLGIILETSTE